MPTPPDITLPKPYVLITQSDSELGLVSVDNNIQFGQVALTYDTSDRVVTGQLVMYDATKTSTLMYGSTLYQLVSDEFVTGQEPPTV